MTTTYTAYCPAIHCEGCAAAIRRVLGKLASVQNIEVDIEGKQVHVEYDGNQIGEQKISERLVQAGFPPEQV